MEATQVKLWTNGQAYGLSAVCLLLGICCGYLVHSPSQAAVAKPPARQEAPRAAANTNLTPEQLKHMADKKAEPLLAELQKHPNDVALLTEIGKTYFYGRQFPTAAEYYERAAKAKPDAELLTSLGSIYHYAGEDQKAIASVNRALQINPKFDGALFNLGMLKLQSQSDPKGAISAWEKLLKANPNHPRRADVEAMIARARTQMNMASAGKADHSSK
jgi:cytochrome c-type biogenesis protein CcmH/NrfG